MDSNLTVADNPLEPGGGTPLVVVEYPGGQREEHPLQGASVHLGRAAENDIVLKLPTVSSRHLQLDIGPAGMTLTDLGSRNGTMLNGQNIAPHVAQPLKAGDVVRVGDLVTGNSIQITVKGVLAPSEARRIDLSELARTTPAIIGRSAACDLALPHPTVSRHHAEIMRRDDCFVIRDLGSANGTFVNGQRISSWVTLGAGDVVQIGPFRLMCDAQLHALTSSLSVGHRLDAVDLGVQVAGGKMILKDVSLSVQAGEFAALVGGSGAGKSTLLKAMNGYNPATHGYMLIDQQALYPNLDQYRMMMAYVPQDDIIHRELPVRLALYYAAKLRLPDASHDEINRRIEDVLRTVEMTEHAEKPVRVLSGGQRKRVSIAVELLAQPSILFLDEPTSGLDPGLEKKLMYDLNRLTDQGRTVLLVTHATANIEQCDHVAFLVKGQLAFYGPPREAISFFDAHDFSDIYLRLAQEVNPDKGLSAPPEVERYYKERVTQGAASGAVSAGLLWAEHYRRSPLYNQYVTKRLPRGPVGPSAAARPASLRPAKDSLLRQIWVLARRQLDLIRYDKRTLFILLLMMPLISLMFMLVSTQGDLVGRAAPPAVVEAALKQELEGEPVGTKAQYIPAPKAINLLTILGLALTQAGTFGAAYEIVKERSIFKRERAVNLRVGSYVLSKALVLGLFAILQAASVLFIVGLRVKMSFEPALDWMPSGGAEMFVTLLLAVLDSIMLGLLISAVVPTQDVVLYVILVELFVQIILGGTLFPLKENAFSKLVPSYWTMNAMGSSVDIKALNEESIICKVVDAGNGQKAIYCESSPLGQDDLKLDYLHTSKHLITCWAALLGQALAWGGLTLWVQARKRID